MNDNNVAVGEALAPIREQAVRPAGASFNASLLDAIARPTLISKRDAAVVA